MESDNGFPGFGAQSMQGPRSLTALRDILALEQNRQFHRVVRNGGLRT